MISERILVVEGQEIRDQVEVERILNEISTSRGEEYVRSVLGSTPILVDWVIKIDPPERGVLKMIIGGREVVVNDRIVRTPDLEIDLSEGDDIARVNYFTVEGTDLIIGIFSKHTYFRTPEQQTEIELRLREVVTASLKELQS